MFSLAQPGALPKSVASQMFAVCGKKSVLLGKCQSVRERDMIGMFISCMAFVLLVVCEVKERIISGIIHHARERHTIYKGIYRIYTVLYVMNTGVCQNVVKERIISERLY